MEEIVFGELPEIIIKVKGQLQHVGLDATAEVIAGALGEKGSSSYHVGQCATWLISEIERELGLGEATVQGRRPRSLSRQMTMGGSNLINRLKKSKASAVDMASLAVAINILFKIMAFEVTAFLQVNSEIAPTLTLTFHPHPHPRPHPHPHPPLILTLSTHHSSFTLARPRWHWRRRPWGMARHRASRSCQRMSCCYSHRYTHPARPSAPMTSSR